LEAIGPELVYLVELELGRDVELGQRQLILLAHDDQYHESPIELAPFGSPMPGARLADMVEVHLGQSGLRVVLTAGKDTNGDDQFIEITFTVPRGFRYLDEGDLLPYWRTANHNPSHNVYEVSAGGWAEQEISVGMLTSTGALGAATGYREGLVTSVNGCLNVIARCEPLIRLL
jgi:hypothetical protein